MTTHTPGRTANHRFRQGQRRRVMAGLILSLALHVVIFFALPVIPSTRQRSATTPELEVVRLPSGAVEAPPRLVIPEPAVPIPVPSPPAPTATTDQPDPIPPPHFTPHDVAPRLLNRLEVKETLLELYPGSLEVMRVGGAVTLWLYVDTEGQVIRTVLRESSQFEAFNRAAEAVARSMRFSPAQQSGNPVAVWVQQSIRFQTMDTVSPTPLAETGGPGEPY